MDIREKLSFNGSSISDDIEVIIQRCAMSDWSDIKIGLKSLTQYLLHGNMLEPSKLQRIIDLLRNLSTNPQIKVYSIFLDALNELILSHSHRLHKWLFVLLTMLFKKLGTEVVESLSQKIWTSLGIIHEYFSTSQQMKLLFKILIDPKQTPTPTIRLAHLRFLTALAETFCSPCKLVTEKPADQAVFKILRFAADSKSDELKQSAKLCFIALWKLNPAKMRLILAELPMQYQEDAEVYIHQSFENGESKINNSSSRSPTSSKDIIISASNPPTEVTNQNVKIRESEVVEKAIGLALMDGCVPGYSIPILENLSTCIAEGNCELQIKYFEPLLATLLKMIESQYETVMLAALQTLSKVIHSSQMRSCWLKSLETILLTIVSCYKADAKNEIDLIIANMTHMLPIDITVNILNSVFATGDFSSNLCALVIIQAMVKKQSADFSDVHLDILMPNVVKLLDASDKKVRKAAVFCLVNLYFVLGEEKVKPKFDLLKSSKVRLLNLYIGKHQGNVLTHTTLLTNLCPFTC